MATKLYRAIFEPDGKEGFSVFFPDFPGCVTAGDTMQEAATSAIEALIAHVEGMIEAEEVIPEPTNISDPLPEWLSDADLSRTTRSLLPLDIDARTMRVNVIIEEGLLARVDRMAKARGLSRSAFLSEAARKMLRDAA